VTSVREAASVGRSPSVQRWSQISARRWRFVPLSAICLVQAGLSLTLVWSNTAYTDEADCLWLGRLVLAHWLHGTSWPSAYAERVLSGSPVIYPPLGALANSVGGLAGARILSLVFMLGATALLYLTAYRLFGGTAAVFATALWAFSEPVIRLAFATCDPLSILLTALSAWLAVEAAYRRFKVALVAAAALALALATVTAYPGILMVPVVIAFAYLVWLARAPARRAGLHLLRLVACYAVFSGALITVCRSESGLMATVIDHVAVHQSVLLVVNDTWTYSGLVLCLAGIGAIAAAAAEGWRSAGQIVVLCCAVLLVPAVKLHNQTGVALDRDLAYGMWFAAIAAGYAVSQLIRWLHGASRRLTCACCVVALAYPAITSWESAWQVYHGWADSTSFTNSFTPVAARATGLIYAGAFNPVAEYYTVQGNDWARWSPSLSFAPSGRSPSNLTGYYAGQLASGNYGAIALFYSTTFSSPGPVNILLSARSLANGGLLNLIGTGSAQPNVAALTHALEADRQYRLVAQGPYYSDLDYGIYAIWQKVRT
jgi:Dolichyl-phosphate-mannose-protein mannosyltransferase